MDSGKGWGGVVFLLGAGCSRSAGVPLADEISRAACVDLAQRYSNGSFQGQAPDDALAWLVRNGDVPDGLGWGQLYTHIFDSHFNDPAHQRAIIGRAMGSIRGINWTHLCLGELVARHYVHTVLTTNFDQLMLDGLIRTGVMPVVADGVESLTRIDGRPDVPQLVHLHGSRHTYNPRNTSRDVLETKRFGEVVRSLRQLLRDSPALVVLGYAGREEGVMDVLVDAARELGGKTIFWVHYDPNPHTLSPKATTLLDLSPGGGVLVGHDADLFMGELMKGLEIGVPAFMNDPLGVLRRMAGEISRPAARTVYAEIETYIERLDALLQSDRDWKARRSDRDNTLSQFRQLTLAGRVTEAVNALSDQKHLLTEPDDIEAYGDAALDAGKRSPESELLQLAAEAYRSAIIKAAHPGERARLYRKLGESLVVSGERKLGPTLQEGVDALGTSLSLLTREDQPLLWAATQHQLSAALSILGDRRGDVDAMQRAIDALDAALEIRSRSQLPLDWAESQRRRGSALRRLGQRLEDPRTLEASIDAYRASLEVWTREQAPEEWARVQTGLANALCTLGERDPGNDRLEEAVRAFESALEVRKKDRLPFDWAVTQNNLAAALVSLGERQPGDANLERAVGAARAAMEVWTPATAVYDWARAQGNLGDALVRLGRRRAAPSQIREAIEAYRAALSVWNPDQAATDWVLAQYGLAGALRSLGEIEHRPASLGEAADAYRAALARCGSAPALARKIAIALQDLLGDAPRP